MRTVAQQLTTCSVKIHFDSRDIDRNVFSDSFIEALSHKK